MGLFDKSKDNSKSKLGEYYLESDKIEISKIRERLNQEESCLLLIRVYHLNNSWIMAVTNMKLILVRKKLNKELEIKTFDIDDIDKIEVQKGKLLGKIVINMGNEFAAFESISNLFVDKIINLLDKEIYNNESNKEIVYKPKELSKRQAEKKYQKDRVAQLKRDKIPFCPKCKSTSLTYQNKKLSVGRAFTGKFLFGEEGAVLGGLTSKKGYVVCLNCGHKWKL